LLARADESVETSLLLSFLIDAKIEDGAAEAGDLADLNARAESESADLDGRIVFKVGDLAGVAGSVDVGDVVGSSLNGSLLGLEGLSGDVETGGKAAHG